MLQRSHSASFPLLLGASIGALIPSAPAFAAPTIGTITVNTASDSDDPDSPPNGLCTLREAINNADNHTQWNGNPDCASGGAITTVIEFGVAPKSKLPIVGVFLNPTFGELSVNASVVITGPVTIVGPAGPASSRVMHVTAGGQLAMHDVSLTHGVQTGDSAGAVLVEGELTMTGGTLDANTADRGGAMAVYGTATLSNVMLSANRADIEGGAIWASGTAELTLEDCTLNVNRSAGPGGAIFQAPGTGMLTIARTSFNANRASGPLGDGGALYGSGAVSIADSAIVRNVAEGRLGGAGAYFSAGARAAIDRSELDANSLAGFETTAGGGAIHHAGGGTLIVSQSNVTRNKAWVGGGAYVGPGTTATVVNSTWAFNVADAIGGPNRADAGAGAAVFADQAFVAIEGSTLRSNSGTSQVMASGPSSHVDLANSVLWSLPGDRNCDGDGTYALIASSAQNVDAIGGSCPMPATPAAVSDVFGPAETFSPKAHPPQFVIDHIVWRPKAPLIGAGDFATCIDPLAQNDRDERGRPRTSCDIGAIEH